MSDRLGINAEVQTRAQQTKFVVKKLLKHFGLPNEVIDEELNLSDELIYSPALREAGFDHTIKIVYCKLASLNLKTLFNAKLFENTTIVESFITGESQLVNKKRFLMILALEGYYLVMAREAPDKFPTVLTIDTSAAGKFVLFELDQFLKSEFKTD